MTPQASVISTSKTDSALKNAVGQRLGPQNKVMPHCISIIGSALDSTPPQAGLRKTLERQPLIDPNREERLWKDDSARRPMTHKISIKPLSKVFGSPVCGGVRPSGFGPRFSEKV